MTRTKPKDARQTKPARAATTKAVETGRLGRDAAKATQGKRGAPSAQDAEDGRSFDLNAAWSDPRWELARSKPEGRLLLQVARMLGEMKGLVERGFHALNSNDPTIIEQAEIKQAAGTARDVQKLLGDYPLDCTYPRIATLLEFTDDIEPHACVEAWRECLQLMEMESLPATLASVRMVATAHADSISAEQPAPCLRRRMHLDDAIRNAKACGFDLATILNARRRHDIDKTDNYNLVRPRDKAFEFARWALKGRNKGARSSSTIKKAYERMRQMEAEYDGDGDGPADVR